MMPEPIQGCRSSQLGQQLTSTVVSCVQLEFLKHLQIIRLVSCYITTSHSSLGWMESQSGQVVATCPMAFVSVTARAERSVGRDVALAIPCDRHKSTEYCSLLQIVGHCLSVQYKQRIASF
jgi:hypothetical protein